MDSINTIEVFVKESLLSHNYLTAYNLYFKLFKSFVPNKIKLFSILITIESAE